MPSLSRWFTQPSVEWMLFLIDRWTLPLKWHSTWSISRLFHLIHSWPLEITPLMSEVPSETIALFSSPVKKITSSMTMPMLVNVETWCMWNFMRWTMKKGKRVSWFVCVTVSFALHINTRRRPERLAQRKHSSSWIIFTLPCPRPPKWKTRWEMLSNTGWLKFVNIYSP